MVLNDVWSSGKETTIDPLTMFPFCLATILDFFTKG